MGVDECVKLITLFQFEVQNKWICTSVSSVFSNGVDTVSFMFTVVTRFIAAVGTAWSLLGLDRNCMPNFQQDRQSTYNITL
jgi:hypothetical protein